MVGTNTLTLNEATICAAIQCYIDAQYGASKLRVRSVKPTKSDGGYGNDNEFQVVIEGVTEKDVTCPV